ncbi:hypothetical protein [Halalkalibacillus halophilus]|uniref:hypothetical protein n=1 Tax=Halalkalibacillus halophilus TaxID=392827 RepID=UPI00040A4CC6|nr:hypothetical protein [Halalkalibacillus halophilus]
MKKHVTSYILIRYQLPKQIALKARRDVPYELKLASRLVMDELVYRWNQDLLESKINRSIDENDQDAFNYYSKLYKNYINHG